MSLRKKTKIVATIGPATENEVMFTKLVKAGLNVARLNFSHGDHPEHQRKADVIRAVSKKLDLPIAILQDLSGPKIRTGEFYQERVNLKNGSIFILTTKKIVGDETKVHVSYKQLPKELKKGSIVLLDDGKKKLEVISTTDTEIKTRVIDGGETKGRRGVNLPGAYLNISSITKKDREDLLFGIKNDVEFVALSFVRKPDDVEELRGMLKKAKSKALIISKIETQEAVENIDEIIAASDGVMVARGDLAIEVPAQKVPMIQKQIINKCNLLGKPVITATQMLESMIHSPVPTRAEVSDIANAIMDGTDAVMLSEETTLGEFPLEAVEVMTRVAREVEMSTSSDVAFSDSVQGDVSVADAVTCSAVNIAHDVGAVAIVALTDSGFTARMLSRFKPDPLIIALTDNEKTYLQLALSSGCVPIRSKKYETINDIFKLVRDFCKKHKIGTKGDRIVIAAGAPFHKLDNQTNTILIEEL